MQPPAEKINASTKLAIARTRLSYERTLMAWVRTAISLISFGFTIYKFFQIEGTGKQHGHRQRDRIFLTDDCLRVGFPADGHLRAPPGAECAKGGIPGNSAAIIGAGASWIDFSPWNSGVS